MNDPLEEQLRTALQRQEAPEGFAERVQARLGERPGNAARSWAWYAAAAVMALVLLFTGIEQQQRRQQRKKARETERQVVFAIALAMQKFEHVNAKLQKTAPTVAIENGQKGESL